MYEQAKREISSNTDDRRAARTFNMLVAQLDDAQQRHTPLRSRRSLPSNVNLTLTKPSQRRQVAQSWSEIPFARHTNSVPG